LFEISFWGTRGTLPAPGPQFSRAGGNTNCTLVRCGEHTIIFDAGTGLRELGCKLEAQDKDRPIHLLLTHAHYDHVEGLPFFAPFYVENSKIEIFCGELAGSKSTKHTVENLMRQPYFPVGPDVFSADVTYNDVKSGDKFSLPGGVKVRTAPLNHPGGATGYRIDFDGRSFACITDTEHVPGKFDANILELIDGVDLFIYDSSLIDEELPEFTGYGHSTYEEGMRLCKEANAAAFLAFHHMPFRVDKELDRIEKIIRDDNPNSGVAREGVTIKL